MGDLYVHEKLRACCRKTLAELDEKKKAARAAEGLLAVGSVVTTLGDNPVDVALGMIAELVGKKAAGRGAGEVGDAGARTADVNAILRSTCAKICALHALEHTGTEARFWEKMADAFDGGMAQASMRERAGTGNEPDAHPTRGSSV